MMDVIEITVRGTARSGKSTVAQYVAQMLEHKGFTIALDDHEVLAEREALNTRTIFVAMSSRVEVRVEDVRTTHDRFAITLPTALLERVQNLMKAHGSKMGTHEWVSAIAQSSVEQALLTLSLALPPKAVK